MNLPSMGREYIHFQIEDAPSGTIYATFDAGLQWWPTVRMSSTEVVLLVAGPFAVANPMNTVVLPLGFYGIFLWMFDGVENVFRPAGSLSVE
jgi:hypothetical protein